ncbi:MAG: PqqD family protein [Clostridium sp.]|jgi:hypothetical protein|nr:PqqD family protein [Clostridium sp.]
MLKPTLKIAWQTMPDNSGEIYIYVIPQKIFLLLQGVAVDIWNGVVSGCSKENIMDDIAAKYSVSTDEIRADMDYVIDDLLAHEVIYNEP